MEDKAAMRFGVKLTRENIPHKVIERLSEVYAGCGYNESIGLFNEQVLDPLLNDPSLNPADLEGKLYERQYTDEDIQHLDLIRLCCAYCLEAIKADRNHESNRSWLNTSFAQFWLGTVSGLRGIAGTADLVRFSQSQKGGRNRHNENYAEVKEYALKLAANHLDLSVKYAASKIYKEVVMEQEQLKKGHFTPTQKTVEDWLYESDLQFGTKRQPKSKNTKT